MGLFAVVLLALVEFLGVELLATTGMGCLVCELLATARVGSLNTLDISPLLFIDDDPRRKVTRDINVPEPWSFSTTLPRSWRVRYCTLYIFIGELLEECIGSVD